MKIISAEENPQLDLQGEKLWLSLGNFDGVHLAHQKLLNDTIAKAKKHNCVSGILLLEPHPEIKFLGKSNFLLTTFNEKTEKISQMGIKMGIVKNFDSGFSDMTSDEYARWLVEKLNIRGVSVGFDYSFGNCSSGDPKLLAELGEDLGFSVSVIPPVKLSQGEKVSSELCRKYIQEGYIKQANAMLTSPYKLQGEVVKGEGRGAHLGFPTANINIPTDKVIPRPGVYLVKVNVSEDSYWGVCNLGKKPTFQGKNLIAETYLLNSHRDLYGIDLEVSFLEFLRDERKFSDSKELITQLNKDVHTAHSLISQYTCSRFTKFKQ